MKVNPLEKHPKLNALFTTAMTLIAAYYGWEKVEQHSAADVDVEVIMPDQAAHNHQHTHKTKDWYPIIESGDERIRTAHEKAFH